MNRPTDKQIEEVLAGVATPEDAKFVAEWFATEEGNTYLDAVMTREADPKEHITQTDQTYLLPCGCNLDSRYFPDRSLFTDQFPGGFIRHYGV